MILPTVFAALPGASFPVPVEAYGDAGQTGLWNVLVHRVQVEPFNLVATVIFALAILHTFLAPKIVNLSHAIQHRHEKQFGPHAPPSIPAAILHFLGEVEVVFGLWAVPLALALVLAKGRAVASFYFDHTLHFTEPLFVVVVMAIAASRPVVDFAGRLLGLAAGRSPLRWWGALLTLGPLLGSFITEPAAMTLCAVLLGREFYRHGPSLTFMYATLGLLFVNVSVGGALTNFAAPPVLMVAAKWNWSTLYMMHHFGLRIVPGIFICNGVYLLIFRREFVQIRARAETAPPMESNSAAIPLWITAVHLAFLGWTVLVAHSPVLFIGGFLFFLGFAAATQIYQDEINLRPPLLVGFFLAGLVIHGGLQAWWIEPVLGRLGEFTLLLGATLLTAFNDNAAVTYLASLQPDFSEAFKQAVMAGAICGGGLTVIANVPNPAGQSILQKYFPGGAISPGGLFLAALGPTLVMLVIFALPR